MPTNKSNFERVHDLVRQIPRGKVAAYGQIARWLGWPRGARTVGWALRALRAGTDVPWHRVVNAQGRISLRGVDIQRALLEAEGVIFDETDKIDMTTYAWNGPDIEWLTENGIL